MDGRTNRRVDGWEDGRTDKQMDGQTDKQMDNKQTGRQTDRWKEMDRWTDKKTDRQTQIVLITNLQLTVAKSIPVYFGFAYLEEDLCIFGEEMLVNVDRQREVMVIQVDVLGNRY